MLIQNMKAGKLYLLIAVCIVAGSLLYGWMAPVSFDGPDADSYYDYAKALSQFNHILWKEGNGTLGPTGHIVCHHSIGTPLFWFPFIIFSDFLSKLVNLSSKIPNAEVLYLFHWLALPFVYGVLWKICRRTGADRLQVAMAFLTGVFGTGFFYYSALAESSEFPAIALSVFLTYLLAVFQLNRWQHYVWLTVLCALLVLVRYDSVSTALAIYGFVFCHALCAGKNRLSAIFRLGFSFLFFCAACTPLLMTNYLFTKNIFQLPLATRLSSGLFANVDYHHPQIGAVLLSPWHGLVTYHPVVLAAVAAGVLYGWRDWERLKHSDFKTIFQRPIYQNLPYLIAALFVLRILTIAVSRYWWQGTAIFGSRYFAFFFSGIIIALAYVFKHLKVKWPNHPVFWFGFLCMMWTFLLHLQSGGQTNFYNFPVLFEGQRQAIQEFLLASPALVWMWCASIAVAMLARSEKIVLAALGLLCLALLLILLPFYGAFQMTDRYWFHVLSFFILGGIFSIIVMIAKRYRNGPLALGVVLLVFFVTYSTGAAWNSLREVRSRPPLRHDYCGTFEVGVWLGDFSVYHRVAGYSQAKMEYANLIGEYIREAEKSGCYHTSREMQLKLYALKSRFAYFRALTLGTQ